MSKMKTEVTVKPIKGSMFSVYLKGVPVWYAKVHEPAFKYKSHDEKEYGLTAFVDEDTFKKIDGAHKLSKEFVTLNKLLKLVGVDKNKNREIKFPLASQIEDEDKKEYGYDAVEGMYGLSLTLNEFNKQGKANVLNIIGKADSAGKLAPFKENLGNGTVCNIKLFGYINKENMLNVQLDTIQVIDHVPYTGMGAGGEVTDDEFGGSYTRGTADTSTKPETSDAGTFDNEDWKG